MEDQTNKPNEILRRDFLRLLGGGALVFAAGNLLLGCGGGGNASSSTRTQTIGMVNTVEIGGSNLAVQSAYKSSAAVTAQGSFATVTSATGSQLLTVTDSAGKLRGLSIANAQGTSSVTFDATSTALALVLLTPGILTAQPSAAAQRINQIKGLTSFAPLSSYLAQKLPSNSLNDLQQDAMLEQLKATCVTDWLTQYGGRAALVAHGRAAGSLAFTAQFTTPPTVTANLTNTGWRFLSIVREDVDADGNSLRVTPLTFTNGFPAQALGLFDGATAVDWGAIFSGSAGMPAQDSDKTVPVSLSDIENIASVKYWLYGPGNALLNDTSDPAPAEVESQFNETAAWGCSLVYYALFPIIDTALGIAGLFLKGVKSTLEQAVFAAQAVWASVQGSVNVASLIQAAKNGDAQSVIAALTNTLTTLIGAAATIIGVLIEEGLVLTGGSTAAEIVGAFLTATSVAFTAANLSIVGTVWTLQYPTEGNIELPVSSAGVTVQ